MSAAPLHIAGERLLLDPGGAVFWPGESVLVVADLHLEKGSAAAERGQLLPPWDTRATLDVLASLLRRYRPKTVVALGDSFHDKRGAERLMAADQARLAAMTRATRFIWVLGNHDPAAQAAMAGEVVAEWHSGPFRFRHEASGPAKGEISGHFHPKATVPVQGTTVTRPCFVTDGMRLMLPALGAYTGGLDVRDAAIARWFPKGGRIFLLGKERVFSFPLAASRAHRTQMGAQIAEGPI